MAFEGSSDLLAVIRVSPRGLFNIESMNQSAIAFFARALPEFSHEDSLRLDMETMFLEKAHFTPAQAAAALAPHREAVRTRAPVTATSLVCTAAGERLARRMTVTPLADRRGRVTHLLYRGVDLTGLRSAEERFERLFELSPVPLSIVRLSDNVRLQANAAWLAFHGYAREQAIGQSSARQTRWVDFRERERMVAELRREGKVPGRQAQFVSPDGGVRDVLASMALIDWAGEQCMVTAVLDVSALEAARREAQGARERFTKLFDLSPVPLSIIRLSDEIRLEANAAWLALHGRTREEAVSRSAPSRTAWADPGQRKHMIATLRREGSAPGALVQLVTAGGRTRDTIVSMVRIEWEGEDCMLVATHDVSEIESARERLQTILDGAPLAISITRRESGERVYVNPAWHAIFGDGALDPGGTAVRAGFWADADERRRLLAPLLERGERVQLERSYRRRDGRAFELLFTAEPIELDGQPSILSVSQDVTEMSQARREAQVSHERFTKLFELSPVPIVIGRLSDGGYLAANAAWLELHGYRREELDGQTSVTLRAWLSAEDRARVVEILRREGEIKGLPVKFRAKSGAIIDTLYFAALIEWGGEPAIVAAPQDITELVRMRREADTQAERFKALFRLSPSPSSVTTLNDGRYLAVNSSWAAAMGYAPEELLDRRALDLGIWPDAAERARFVSELKTRGALRHLPVRFRTRRGDIRQMQISSELIEWSGVPAILSSMYDVTDLERARSEAQASSERFLQLFESNPVPINITRIPDGTVLEVNRAWLQLRGLTREEALGRTTLSLRSWVDREQRDRIVADIATGAVYRNYPTQLRGHGDDVREVLYSGVRVEWLGEPAIVAFLVDVTDITRAGEKISDLNESLEQKVLERTAELEAANRELESFSYSVSHDLRSPLGAINGFAHVLRMQESGRLSADGDRLLGLLERDAERMAQLVDGLLDFSRLGRKPVTKSAVAMAELVAGVTDELRGKHDARRARVSVGALPPCGGDAMLLRQVWWNLLDNALKYSRRSDPALIEVGHDAVAAAYFIRDNGVGFDMRHAGKLFGVFERLHADSEFEGTGIGLATTARIVLRHGGRIWCDAAPGKGATFYFSLPA